jgi:putative transposase
MGLSMSIVTSFLLFVCVKCLECQRMDTIIGAKEERVRESRMMTLLQSVFCDAYDANRGVYGSPRIHAELKAQGIHCGRKRIVRLMQEKGISAQRKRRKARTTNSNHSSPIAPNLLKRDFTADAPNKKWVTDITYIATYEGWLYLAGILDTYSRKIIGWAMGKQHDAELVKEALHMALIQRQPGADLVHHSYAWNL